MSKGPKITDNVLRRALVYGTILASFTVEKFSAEGLVKTSRDDIKKRYRLFEKLTRF